MGMKGLYAASRRSATPASGNSLFAVSETPGRSARHLFKKVVAEDGRALWARGLRPISRQPAVTVRGRPVREVGVGFGHVGRFPLDACIAAKCHGVDGIVPPGYWLVLSCTDAEYDTGSGLPADDCVLRAGRAVDEIPLVKRSLLAFDE